MVVEFIRIVYPRTIPTIVLDIRSIGKGISSCK